MLKKTITYEDFNGDEVVEDFYFHLSQAELVELEMSHEGGLSEALQRIIAAEDNKAIITEFKNIIMSAYGKRSEDGKRFIKNQNLREEFESTEAYSVLFMELITDTDSAIEFITGIVPAKMASEVAKLTASQETPIISVAPEKDQTRIVTRKNINEMTREELDQLGPKIASGEVKISESTDLQ